MLPSGGGPEVEDDGPEVEDDGPEVQDDGLDRNLEKDCFWVHNNQNFFGFEFEFYTLFIHLVMLKY
jgi:hypothetical protein